MSNVVNKHKIQSNNNIARVSQHQSLNPRGSTPAENLQRPGLTYSNVARQGIQPSHETVLNKSHPNANSVQQVVIAQQSNLSSNVNPTGSPMPAPTGPNTGANQLSVLQNVPQVMPQTGPRFSTQPFHQHPRPPQRAPLLTHRTQNSVPTSSGVVQAVQQSVGPSNMSHTQHQHYYIMQPPPPPPQMPQIQSQMISQQHMSHAVNYQHQTRNMHQGMPQYFTIPYNQQAFGQQPYPYAMAYQTQYHQPHGQQAAQHMMSQIHTSRGAPVSQPVIQTPLAVQVPGPVSSNNEVNESQQIQQKPVLPKRQRCIATITDPNSGKNLNLEELVSKDVSKNQTVVNATNDSHSGADNLLNASSTSTSKSNSANDMDIALQFNLQVVQKATETLPHLNTNSNSIVSDPNLTPNIETEQLVANSNVTLSELSEKNHNISDNSESNSVVANETNSSISASISNFNTENDIKLLNSNSAQNLNENNSQISVELSSEQEIQQNGDTTDSSNQLSTEIDEIAKDHQIQKVNNNQRNKETLKKGDKILSHELEDIKINNESDVTDNINVIEKELQTPTDSSSSAMPTDLSQEIDETLQKENVCNNINELEFEKKNAENIRFNEISETESLNNNEITKADLTIPLIKTNPDLPYKDDQWSPVNPEGKKQYDRSFLVAVRKQVEKTLKMPERLTQIAVDIIRKPHQESSGSNPISDDPFLPNYASKQGDFRNRLLPQVNRRQSQPGRNHSDKARKIISTSLTQDVKLHTTDNAWKPSKLASNAVDLEEQETLELLKKFRGILNKLTPQKYDDLLKQIMGLKVDTEDRLKRVLDLIFEKAVDEPAFCLQYANLCKHIANFKVNVNKGDNSSEEVKFQKLLLSKCQKEFEADVYASIEDLKERKQKVEECTDTVKKKALFEILDEDMRRARKRSLGNIKLIGELYKLHMLRGNIMLQCIENLCNEKDDESLECLCALLKTIGEQIEEEAATKTSKTNYTAVLDNFFVKMDKIANQQCSDVNASPRVRFMLRDVIDMRKNNWKARRDENLPKMIDEIHQEAKKEDEQRAQDLRQHEDQKRKDDKSKRGGRQGTDSTDQWQTVTARKSQTMQPQTQTIDWSKMRTTMGQNHDNVQLGPQTGLWGFGSRGGAGLSSQSKSAVDDKHVNRFSPLESGMSDRKSQKSSNIPSRDSSRGRSNQQHNYQQSGSGRRPQPRGEREDAISLARSFSQKQSPSESYSQFSKASKSNSRSTSREHSASSSRNSSTRRETPDIELNDNTLNVLKGENIPDAAVESRAQNSIKEYLSEKNLNEASLDITSLCNDSNVHLYISTAINCALEISSQTDQFAIGNLFCHLLTNNIIKFDQFFKGLHSILDSSEDIEIDVPMFWDYIGDVLAPIFVELASNERKQFLLDAAKPCINTNRISKLIVKVVKAIAKLTSESKANELWFSSNLNWNEFLEPNEDIQKFVEQNNVKFTINESSDSTNCEQNLYRFSEDVVKLVRDNNSNDEIQSFISKYFNASQTSDPRFTSALFSAVIRGCLTAPLDSSYSFTLETNKLNAISPLLVKFFGGDQEIELQALVVLQGLMGELQHPPNLLNQLFHILYENAVISHDAFLQWAKCDPNSSAKAMAVSSVMRFLTWLQENEEDDEDNELTAS